MPDDTARILWIDNFFNCVKQYNTEKVIGGAAHADVVIYIYNPVRLIINHLRIDSYIFMTNKDSH
jgi:hypothetical protein